jgi:hypothetical protein
MLGIAVALIWWRDWWPAERGDQWTAVAAIGTAMTALIALGGLAAVLLARAQLGALHRQTRIDLAPYLRVDLSLNVPNGQWRPPEVDPHYQLTRQDLYPLTPAPRLFEGWRSDDEVEVFLWVTNQQSHPSGLARWIVINLEFEVSDPPAGDSTQIVDDALFLHYIEPGRVVRLSLGRLARHVPYLSGRVTGLAYSDITGDALSLGHGSTEFEWDGRRLANYRNVLLGSEDREYGN